VFVDLGVSGDPERSRQSIAEVARTRFLADGTPRRL
jgi:hypothetical protein